MFQTEWAFFLEFTHPVIDKETFRKILVWTS